VAGEGEILRKGFDEFARFVNPMIAQRASLAGEPTRVTRAADGILIDAEGREIEDLHGTQALGHRNPRVAEALRGFLDSDAPSWYPSRVSPFAGRLARRLCERTGYEIAFFACTGSDIVEAALKLARALTRRPRILCLEGAYHGCTYGSVSMMAKGPLHDPFGPHLPGVERIPFGDADALGRAMGDDVCAVVVEPIQGEGGVRVLPEPFVEALCGLTARHGALLVADEIQTGLGRTGRGFLRTERWARRPDVALVAKTLGGGLVPISALLTRREIFLGAYGHDFREGESHNTTFSYNSLAAVAGLATLDLITDDVIARIREGGAAFRRELESRLAGSPLFVDVRGEGYMVGIKFRQPDHPWLTFEHFGYPQLAGQSVIGALVCHRLYKRGFICYPCGHDWSILRLQPRFDIPFERLTALAKAIREELDYLCRLA
jgi:acetylornithine/succinyldiaminopimelate/putrescine aminotransferase